MIPLSQLSARDVRLGAGVAVAALAAYWLLLWTIAQPAHFKTRLATVTEELAQADAVRRAPGNGSAYPLNATCKGEPAAMDSLVKQQIASAAAAAGVDLAIGESGLPGEPERNQKLLAYTVGFDATGPYSNVLAFAGKLGQLRPALFIDTLGLDQDDAAVKLKFSGRVLCSTAAL